MPVDVKVFSSWLIVLGLISVCGLSTVGNEDAQYILNRLAVAWLVVGLVAALWRIWL